MTRKPSLAIMPLQVFRPSSSDGASSPINGPNSRGTSGAKMKLAAPRRRSSVRCGGASAKAAAKASAAMPVAASAEGTRSEIAAASTMIARLAESVSRLRRGRRRQRRPEQQQHDLHAADQIVHVAGVVAVPRKPRVEENRARSAARATPSGRR